ncbi:MAG: hypothetical protein IJ111_10830, partial [Eggerthellaceae bacterium]|nr:hypothetical protein [Eggerthellaceae bacterium]
VRAAEGAFPEGARLEASLVADGAEQAKVESVVQAERAGGRHVAASYVIDVSVLDADGAELQPADGAAVEVSFAAAEAADQNLTAGVYHVHEMEGGVLEAEALDVTEEGGAATASTDGFSYYTVEFTYNDLQYVMEGDATVALADILAAVGLSGEPSAVSVSDPELFSAAEQDGVWAVTAHKAFTSTEWMKVTIAGVGYQITVTDDTLPSWATSAGLTSDSASWNPSSNTVTLNQDVTVTGTMVVSGIVVFDLNGHNIVGSESGSIFKVETGGTLTLTGTGTLTGKRGSTTNGSLQGQNATGADVYINGGTFNLQGGTLTSTSDVEVWGGSAVGLDGGAFNMSGGELAGSAKSTCGVVLILQGTFTMTGGSIHDNKSSGVQMYRKDNDTGHPGSFIMEDGSIYNNTSGDWGGGGVKVEHGAFAMTGGSIHDNVVAANAQKNGGGVLVSDNGTMSVSGGARIYDNKAKNGSDRENVYLAGKEIAVSGPLSDDASIGITMQSPGVFTSSATGVKASDYQDRFTSDDPNYSVVVEGNELKLGAPTDYQLYVGGVHVTSAKTSGEGWSYDAASNTLTLKNYKFSGTGEADGVDPTAIYYAPQDKAFRIVLEGANSITQGHKNGGTTWGIYSRSDFTIGGTGTLDVTTADGAERAAAIYSEKNLEITGGTINATSGSVTGGPQGYGIGGGGTVLTIGEGAKVALAGPKGATNMTVKNAALGVGWADAAGTQGKALVEASEPGQDLVSYQKVQFPAKTAAVTFKVAKGSWDDGTAEDKTVTLFGAESDTLKLAATDIPAVGGKPGDGYKAGTWDTAPSTETAIAEATTYTYTYAQKEAAVVAKPPVAEELTASGQAQALVTAATAEGGTMQYAIGKDADTAPTTGWGASIPTGTDAGTYYVWYKAVGDEGHLDSKAASVTVTIAPKPTYSCASGDGASWTKGSSDPLTFTFKRSVDDGKTYKAFKGAKVDGTDVPESAYATAEGSLVLSMTTTYLETLPAGEHELTAVFEDGEAAAKFTVNDAKTRPAAAASSDSSSPKTGDALPVATLAACAALGAAMLLVSRARLRKPAHAGKHARR